MDLVNLALVTLAQLLPQVPGFIHQLAPAVPVAVAACVLYLIANDALDCALVAKAEGKKAQLWDFLTAVANDVAQKQALSMAAMAVVTVALAGGDFRAQVVAALVTVAAANVANLEASTKQKLAKLLS